MTLEDSCNDIRIEACSGYIENDNVVYYIHPLKDPITWSIISIASLGAYGVYYMISPYLFN